MPEINAPRYQTVEIDGEPYTVLVNPPFSIWADLQSGIADRMLVSLRRIVKTHPWTDGGKPVDLGELDPDDLAVVVKGYTEALQTLPKASAPRSVRRT